MAVVFQDNQYSTHDPVWRRVLDNLSDVWDGMTTGPITAAHMAWEKCAKYYRDQIFRKKFSHTLLSDEFTKPIPDDPMPVQLWFVDEEPPADTVEEGVAVCLLVSGSTYKIPEYIRDIGTLQDRLNDPEISLFSWNGDFVVTSNLLGGYTGTIEFISPVGEDLHVARRMWATRYSEKKNSEMVSRLGAEVAYNEAMFTEYRTYYDLLFLRATLLFGPSRPSLAAAFTIILGWPYSMIRAKIVDKAVDNSTITIAPYPYPDGATIEIPNPTELPFDYIIGEVVEAATPLTSAIAVLDRMNYPSIIEDFIVNPAEVFHKGLLVFNGDIAITGDVLGLAVPPAIAFLPNDRVDGTVSGAWGYVWEVPAGGLSLKLYGVVGAFLDGEHVVGDIAGKEGDVDFTNGELDPEYNIDFDKVDAFMEKTARYGADLEVKLFLDFRMTAATYATSYGRPVPMLEIEGHSTGPDDVMVPEITSINDFGIVPSAPVAYADTSMGLMPPVLDAEHITTWGIGISAPVVLNVWSNVCGWLGYKFSGGAPFKVGMILSGGTSGATGIIAADENDGVVGRVQLISVHGQFEIGETITDEGVGSAVVTSGLQ